MEPTTETNEVKQCGICGKPFEEGDATVTQTVDATEGSEAYERVVHESCIEAAPEAETEVETV